MQEIIIIAGPNGAGKTSFARNLLAVAPEFVFTNADEIAKTLPSRPPTTGQRDIRAGRIMLDQIAAQIELRRNVMLETTLASRSLAVSIPKWQALGYEVTLYYLQLASAEFALQRVARRVAGGGHNIPDEVIRRRFDRSQQNFKELYKGMVDQWSVYDVETQRLIAFGRN